MDNWGKDLTEEEIDRWCMLNAIGEDKEKLRKEYDEKYKKDKIKRGGE